MKIRLIMDCLFSSCSLNDTVDCSTRKMIENGTSYLIAVDAMNRYRGILKAPSLLEQAQDRSKSIGKLVEHVPPVNENDPLTSLSKTDSDIIPVIDDEQHVVGILSARSLIEYLPELLDWEKQRYRSTLKNRKLNSRYTIDDIIGQSKEILMLKERIIAAAKTRSTVLILGETGTGKELVAHAIHRLSDRRHQPFVRISCASIPENLLESELFGYEPGAFTGAVKGGHEGKFELAHGGTILLDEIGDMPLPLQAKILRVLQEREIERIGGRSPISVDVRIISATHRDLLSLVRADRFRKDLYYRLHVIPIHTPPLRDYVEDISLLIDRYLMAFSSEYGIEKPRVEQEFVDKLLQYSWPGNVRELVNLLDMAVTLSKGVVTCEHLPLYYMTEENGDNKDHEEAASLRTYTLEAERDVILKAVDLYQGNKVKIAEALGISRSSLYSKLHRYGIEI